MSEINTRTDYVDGLLRGLGGEHPSNAYWESKQFSDVTVIGHLAEVIVETNTKKSKVNTQLRGDAYYILAQIGINTGDVRVQQALMHQLSQETNVRLLCDLLDYILEQTGFVPDHKLLFPLLSNKSSRVRESVISVLCMCKSAEVEEELLRYLATCNNEYELQNGCLTLSRIGTDKSHHFLIEKTRDRRQWVRQLSYYALVHIGDESLVPVFLNGLRDRVYLCRNYALIGICKFGGEDQAEVILKAARKLLNEHRMFQMATWTIPTDLIHALTFLKGLSRWREKTLELVTMIRQEKWDALSEEEQLFIQSEFQ